VNLVHPIDDARSEIGQGPSGIPYPPEDWRFLDYWGVGHAFQHSNGLRVIIDCSRKEDDKFWVHVSLSRKSWTPTYDDLRMVKRDFLGDRYAYQVFPPEETFVNIHNHCLHLWSLAEGDGQVLPEFSGTIDGVHSI